MTEQVQISIDKDVYQRLQELCVPPVNSINDLLRQFLINEGKGKTKEAMRLEASVSHRSMEEEKKAAETGVYDSSGISP